LKIEVVGGSGKEKDLFPCLSKAVNKLTKHMHQKVAENRQLHSKKHGILLQNLFQLFEKYLTVRDSIHGEQM
jgi:hypothetical protein